ncbi:MAG: hypothetical protein IKU33_06230 [Bacteroidales bacterium]|nr:hypothetical protein [Bacteroidales bacterium]
MKLNIRVLAALLMIFMGFEAYAQQQNQPDILEQAEMEADRLQRLLDLEDWQTFYIDSTLKHDYSAMLAEYEQLQKAKVSNSAMYLAVQDKWRDKMDEAFRRFLNDEQWDAYLKTGAGKAQKARAKRKAKAEGKK